MGIGTAIGIGASLISAKKGEKAAKSAAAAQGASADKAIEFQREALETIRGDLAPYRDAGTSILYGRRGYTPTDSPAETPGSTNAAAKTTATAAPGSFKPVADVSELTADQMKILKAYRPDLAAPASDNGGGPGMYAVNRGKQTKGINDFFASYGAGPGASAGAAASTSTNPAGGAYVPGSGGYGLIDLVSDPNAQLDYIQQNPFFDALAKRSSDTLMANAAAKGKLASGGTAEALQNSILLLGTDLLNQNITQRQNIANMGANAAAQTATMTQNNAGSVADLITDKGNTQAAGIIGANNARNVANYSNPLFNLGKGFYGSPESFIGGGWVGNTFFGG